MVTVNTLASSPAKMPPLHDSVDEATRSSSNSSTVAEAKVVIIDWNELVLPPQSSPNHHPSATTVAHALRSSLGLDGVGLVAIRNVPGFVEAKSRLFSFAHKLVHLPADYLEDHLADPESLYNAGWSHGKEKLKNDQPDTAKGSFYYNPISDLPGTEEDRAKYPLSYPANKWPEEEIMPGFKQAAAELGKILHQAVAAVSQHVDALAAASSNFGGDGDRVGNSSNCYPGNFLYHQMKDTDKVKARFLYYYPLLNNNSDAAATATSTREDSWIGWHNDSGFFTALAGDMYLNHETGEFLDGTHVDPAAGLYVISRQEQLFKVTIPADCLAVQMGECTQIVTGGAVLATPHCVRGCISSSSSGPHVARVSLACFVDAPPTFPLTLPPFCPKERVLNAAVSHRVPPLEERWVNNMTFGDFLQTTFTKYYELTTLTKDPHQ